MKSYQLNILSEDSQVFEILNELVSKNQIQLHEIKKQSISANDQQIGEMIEEAELGPYYSKKQAQEILNL
tara:strand:+ start:105 stop:314 length:210 start_codon:yes stop_codon:yes gene_type:complete